jgi:hypothetical protein
MLDSHASSKRSIRSRSRSRRHDRTADASTSRIPVSILTQKATTASIGGFMDHRHP